MLRFAVQAERVPGESFQEKFENLARWGYEGIEVAGDALLQRGNELRKLMREYPVAVTSACGGYQGWLVDRNPRARNLAIAEIQAILAAGAELGIGGLVAPAAYGLDTRGVLPPFRSAFSLEEERKLLVDSLAQIADAAQQTGGTLLLEPLNRYEDRVLNTLAEAVAIIDEVGSPAIRLMPDFFHMNIEEPDIAGSLQAHIDYIGHVHLADSNRQLPGLGHTDFVPSFRVLQEAGFEGTLALECRVAGDPMETLPAALAFLRQAAGQ